MKILNSEEKRIHLSKIKKHTQQPTYCSPLNLNSLFNISKNNNVNNELNINTNNFNNNINITGSLNSKNLNKKGNIKLKHINSTLLSNKIKNNISSENKNNIYYRTGSQVPKNRNSLTYETNKIKDYLDIEKEKNIENIINDNKNENDEYDREREKEIEMKNHFFLDNDKLKLILCKRKVKKNHGHKKDLKFKIKAKNIENEDENINKRYNNNDYKQVPTDINSLDNNYNSINTINNATNQKVINQKQSKNENQFVRNYNRKETFNNILPKLKLSYTRRESNN
jgi:hypothetical protein